MQTSNGGELLREQFPADAAVADPDTEDADLQAGRAQRASGNFVGGLVLPRHGPSSSSAGHNKATMEMGK